MDRFQRPLDTESATDNSRNGRFRCNYCRRRKGYKYIKALENHLKKHHPDVYAQQIQDSEYFSRPGKEPTPPTIDGKDRFSEIVATLDGLLIHDTVEYHTTLKTTNRIELQDYDSDSGNEAPPPGENFDMDLGEQGDSGSTSNDDSTTALREEYPTQPIIYGEDQTNRLNFILKKEQLWEPFANGYSFKLARWMTDARVPNDKVSSFFNQGLARDPPDDLDGTPGECFTSAHTMNKLLDGLDPEMGLKSWTSKAVAHTGYGNINFFWRDLEQCIRHIFKQPAHEPYMAYMPVKEWDAPDRKYRTFTEMHTAQWWWEAQVSISRMNLSQG
mgnify:FL=1